MAAKEAVRPENVIKSIAEIPQVLEKENVKQPVIYLSSTIKGKECDVVLLGETHIATKGEEQAANRILPYFRHIGCEGVDIKGFIEGRFFFWAMEHIVSHLVSILSFREKRSKKNKSFLDKAYEYYESETKEVFMLERGWKPSVRIRIFSVAFPVFIFKTISDFAIITAEVAINHNMGGFLIYIISVALFVVLFEKMPILKDILRFIIRIVLNYVFDLSPSRERNMIKNLIADLNADKAIDEIIILTGAYHTPRIAKVLKSKYGFIEKSF